MPALTVSSSFLIWIIVRYQKVDLYTLLRSLSAESSFFIASILTIGLLVIYAASHILDLLSLTIFERLLSDKLNRYPHERAVPSQFSTIRYKAFQLAKISNIRAPRFPFEGVKALICSTSIFFFVNILLRHPSTSSYEITSNVLLVAKWCCVFVMPTAILLALPRVLILSIPIGSVRERVQFINKHEVRTVRFIIGLILLMPVYLYDIADFIIKKIFRLNKAIDTQTFINVSRMAKSNLGIEFAAIGNNDRFWLPYFYVMDHGGEVARVISNARKKANFYRNQAAACFIASIFLASSYHMYQDDIDKFFSHAEIIHIAIALFIFGWLFHWKFLQQYYSLGKMVLQTFSILPEQKSAKANNWGQVA